MTSNMTSLKLEQLFRRCDADGNGYISGDEFRDLCNEFEISQADSDVIFTDLDHDGDGQINFEDFSFGFRDFLVPGSRRGSIQLGLLPTITQDSGDSHHQQQNKQKNMEANHIRAQKAWKNFADNMGRDNVRKFLARSGDKMLTLFEELKGSDAPTHLVEGFEDALASLLKDVKTIENEHFRMEEQFNRERESHSAHLATIEAELDQQVAKVEAAARAQARLDFEAERRAMQEKMEAEINELQTHLRLFQKVDQWMTKEDQHVDTEAKKRLEDATQENRTLKNIVSETQTNIAILRSEMSQVKNQYEAKINEMTSEKESMMQYVYEYDNLNRQLQLLHDANKKLQDTNDSMRHLVDMPTFRSPQIGARSENHPLSITNLEPSTDGLGTEISKLEHMFRTKGLIQGSRSPSEFGGSGADTDSLRSRDYDRPRLTEVKFGINRLLDDLDSGHSTLPGEEEWEDPRRVQILRPPSNLEEEIESAEVLDSLEGELTSIQDNEIKERALSAMLHARRCDSPVRGPFYQVREVVSRRNSVRRPKHHSVPGFTLTSRPNSPLVLRRKNSAFESALRDLEPTGPPDRTYKVVFAGDAAVGKTSFINRITKGVFLSNLSSTLGVDFQVKTIRVDDRNIAIQLWDTAGQERFRSVTKTYFRRADGVMLLYDVTSDRSFSSVRHWVESIDEVSEKRVPIILCGNKVDQRASATAEGRRCVFAEDGEKMARDYSAIFMETSSKDGKNIMDSLVLLAREMCSSEDVEVQTSALKLREVDSKTNCCAGKKRPSPR